MSHLSRSDLMAGLSILRGGGVLLDENHEEDNTLKSYSPIDGKFLGGVRVADRAQYEDTINAAHDAFVQWRMVPAPQRGEVVRKIAETLREEKRALARLISVEMGKILSEAEGEVQEAIDIADYAAGLSRQLNGLTMPSERPRHRLYEQWHPIGPVGVITAFNFPLAVWAWNAMIAAVCGDTIVWKPSELTPMVAVAAWTLCSSVVSKMGYPAIFGLLCGGPDVAKWLAADKRIPLVSATGSTRMGRCISEIVARRLGRCILELSGNNATIVLKDADLDLAVRSIVFSAVGTSGQRCTSTRRLIVEREICGYLQEKLVEAYSQIKVGDPLEKGVLMGPLVTSYSIDNFAGAMAAIREQGGKVLYGGKLVEGLTSELYVMPTIVESAKDMPILKEEIFVPILHIIEADSLEEAISIQNNVPQGLSSSIFTNNLRFAETFLSAMGSDCGIANVNTGTSGAEIGAAFGGEKDSGSGREAGSDAWKQYMRRQSITINFGKELPLSQGIKFQ